MEYLDCGEEFHHENGTSFPVEQQEGRLNMTPKEFGN